MQFPRRGELSLPNPTLSGVQMNRRDGDAPSFDTRNANELDLPEGKMDVASLGMRRRDGIGLGDGMGKPESMMQGVL